MPTSGLGSKRGRPVRRRAVRSAVMQRGFTLIELLIVIAIIAVSVAVVSLALRDNDASKLEEEGARLSALLEMARAEARASGTTVRWLPAVAANDSDAQFRFIGLPAAQTFPTRWLAAGTSAQVVGAATVLLGPEAILPSQRIVLRLAERKIELASDGLAPFAVAPSP